MANSKKDEAEHGIYHRVPDMNGIFETKPVAEGAQEFEEQWVEEVELRDDLNWEKTENGMRAECEEIENGVRTIQTMYSSGNRPNYEQMLTAVESYALDILSDYCVDIVSEDEEGWRTCIETRNGPKYYDVSDEAPESVLDALELLQQVISIHMVRNAAPHVQAMAAFELGRMVERMHVRPFEKDVALARRVSQGRSHSLSEEEAQHCLRRMEELEAEGMKFTSACRAIAKELAPMNRFVSLRTIGREIKKRRQK